MSTEHRQRPGYIPEMQIARGIGILLVTIGHSEPIAVEFPFLFTLIYSFHMPLFFFMSGFFSQGLINSKWVRDILPRTARLYLPYLLISMVYAAIKLIFPATVKRPVILEELPVQLLLYPFDNPALFLWFLYILLLMKLLSPVFRGCRPVFLVPVFVVTASWYGSIDLFGTWSLLKHLLYYTLGILLGSHRALFRDFLKHSLLRWGAVPAFPLLYWFSHDLENGLLPVATALAGIWLTLVVSFFRFPEKIKSALETCGALSLEVYLLQYFFIFPVLSALSTLGLPQPLIVPCTFLAGLLGPVVCTRLLLDRSPVLALLVSGRRMRSVQCE
ncbi:MAG: hypothetical protein CSA33_02205 [Desulfobulbus propionicus]|nr:MAG: hypothetical protein CSA33_02205 [Desulfobulbus propionicus]